MFYLVTPTWSRGEPAPDNSFQEIRRVDTMTH